nr:hypothetical protein [Phytophthora pini]
MVALFHPFRRPEDFDDDIRNGGQVGYERWWRDHAPTGAREFLKFSKDYNISREIARQRIDDDMARYRGYIECSSDEEADGSSILEGSSGEEEDMAWDDNSSQADTALVKSMTEHTLKFQWGREAVQLSAASSDVPLRERFANVSVPVDDRDKDIAATERLLAERETKPVANGTMNLPEAETKVILLRGAIANCDIWMDPTLIPNTSRPELGQQSSLQEISQHFSLNEKQHKAFVRFGKPFVRSHASLGGVLGICRCP